MNKIINNVINIFLFSVIEFIQKAAYIARFGNSVEKVEKVKTVLLDWAKINALKEGINKVVDNDCLLQYLQHSELVFEDNN